MLGCLLVLQRICIVYFYFCVLLLHRIPLITLFLFCCMCAIWLIALLCFANGSIVALGNNILHLSCTIRLTPLPVSPLYSSFALFCLLLVSSFVMMLDLMLLKHRHYIYHIYMSYPPLALITSLLHFMYGSTCLHNGPPCFWGAPMHILDVVVFAHGLHGHGTFFPYAGHYPGGWEPHSPHI